MKINKEIPYNDLPLLTSDKELETQDVLKGLISAHRELSGLKGVVRALPNSEILFITLPLQEAKISSEIENIFTTTDKLYEALTQKQTKLEPQVKEVLRYRKAIETGLDSLKERGNFITTNLCEEICSTVKGKDMKIRKTSDTVLKNQNNETVYTPPQGEKQIRDLLKNWEDFINTPSDDKTLDPLVKMAMMHYQFEAIHPFADGNGRTGRILNTLFLIQQNLLDGPVLYLSHYFIQHKNKYYQLLNDTAFKNTWEPWLLYFIKAIEVTSRQTRKKIEKISQLFDECSELIKNTGLNNSKQLTEVIFEKPYITTEHFTEKKLGTRLTATKHLDILVEKGILEKRKQGRMNFYINYKLMALIKEWDN